MAKWWFIIGGVLTVTLALFLFIANSSWAIPEISGQVVDAVSGHPVPHLDVTLRSTYGVLLGSEYSLLYENIETDEQGRFRFSPYLRLVAPFPFGQLEDYEGYWISVNYRYQAPTEIQSQQRSGIPTSADIKSEFSEDILANPDQEPSSYGAWVNNRGYFMMVLEFAPKRSCHLYQDWAANCFDVDSRSATGLRIALIPVLDDVSGCDAISDPTTQEKCVELNSYRSALIKENPGLCQTLQIAEARVNLREYCVQYLLPLIQQQKLEQAFVPQIGSYRLDANYTGLIQNSSTADSPYRYSTVGYFGAYISDGDVPTGNYSPSGKPVVATVYVNEFSSVSSTQQSLTMLSPTWLASHSVQLGIPTTENGIQLGPQLIRHPVSLGGGKVVLYDGQRGSDAYWRSGCELVQINTYSPFSDAETQGIVSAYLDKYPTNVNWCQ